MVWRSLVIFSGCPVTGTALAADAGASEGCSTGGAFADSTAVVTAARTEGCCAGAGGAEACSSAAGLSPCVPSASADWAASASASGGGGTAGSAAEACEVRCVAAGVPPAGSMTASRSPMATVAFSSTTSSRMTPAHGAGISVSTLSVATSTKGSPASTVSPTALSQRVITPSSTLSPSSGITNCVDTSIFLCTALGDLAGQIQRGGHNTVGVQAVVAIHLVKRSGLTKPCHSQ